MKARIRETGVLIDVIPKINSMAQSSGDNLYVSDNKIYRECELDFLNVENKAIDWEQRRYEIAKSAMQGIFAGYVEDAYRWANRNKIHNSIQRIVAQYAVACADALIEELKKK